MDNKKWEELFDKMKHAGSVQRDDILLIPQGTTVINKTSDGLKTFIFPETVRVRVDSTDYGQFTLGRISADGEYLGSYPKDSRQFPQFATTEEDDIPNWSLFKVKE